MEIIRQTAANEGRSIGVSFTVGECNEVPTFVVDMNFWDGNYRKKRNAKRETYQNNDVFTVSGGIMLNMQ